MLKVTKKNPFSSILLQMASRIFPICGNINSEMTGSIISHLQLLPVHNYILVHADTHTHTTHTHTTHTHIDTQLFVLRRNTPYCYCKSNEQGNKNSCLLAT
ncbi:unnamed protein product [Ceratitis capitata]|uniref:(Mediterranean fruit fly) hypothetical protein n=1 Tax=Ceratitis capitata TaxID=7213 RepID=A0A811VHV1_CERCA|nr:unnamed protein product [Ceratitis capitata]